MGSPITTHVLDTALGRPAAGLAITMLAHDGERWHEIAAGTTDEDGRITDLLAPGALGAGDYRMMFDTGSYMQEAKREVFYPRVTIDFRITDSDQHYHIPLLLSPFSYTTYRGS